MLGESGWGEFKMIRDDGIVCDHITSVCNGLSRTFFSTLKPGGSSLSPGILRLDSGNTHAMLLPPSRFSIHTRAASIAGSQLP